MTISQSEARILASDQSEAALLLKQVLVDTMGGPSITPVWLGSVFTLSHFPGIWDYVITLCPP